MPYLSVNPAPGEVLKSDLELKPTSLADIGGVENMAIRLIDQQYVDRSPPKGLGCRQSTETTADYNNKGNFIRHSSLQSDSEFCVLAAGFQ